MNYGLILAGGVGQRMRNSGMPKQFLNVFGKPIIVYTLEKFSDCEDIDEIVVVCNPVWVDHLKHLLSVHNIEKIKTMATGGENRQDSLINGLKAIEKRGAADSDVVVIHDGVRPLVQTAIISENIRIAKEYGAAMTVRPVIESVVVTDNDNVCHSDFKVRDETYSLTAPQSFRIGDILTAYNTIKEADSDKPLLDAALIYTATGQTIHLVKENNTNLKITTPEDYYILKALLELEENKYIFGI